MLGASNIQRVTDPFGTHIQDLRDFFQSRHLRYGSAGDIVPFVEMLSSSGEFADEMSCMVRSIICREGERLSREQLLELVAVAVGGPYQSDAATGVQVGIRELYVFITKVLRSRSHMIPDELPQAESPAQPTKLHVTTPQRPFDDDKKFAQPLRIEPDLPAVVVPQQNVQNLVSHLDEQTKPATNEHVLFRKYAHHSEAEDSESGTFEPTVTTSRWAARVAILSALILGIVGLFAKSTLLHHNGLSTVAPAVAGLFNARGAPESTAAIVCGVPANPKSTRGALDEKYRRGHNLAAQKLNAAALPELRDVATLDPGYPGINLDISSSLLQLNHPEQAREAIDSQIATSDCLSKLPAESLDAYCKLELPQISLGGCRPQLAHIGHAARLQAALVHLQLGRSLAAGSNSMQEKSGSSLRTITAGSRVPALKSGNYVSSNPAANTASPPVRRMRSLESTLTHGEGTDADLGAYPKQ